MNTKLTMKDPLWWTMYAIFAPIMVWPGYEETAREWRDKVSVARMKKVGDGDHSERATDAEVALYMMTASMIAPMDADTSTVYLHVAGKAFPAIPEVMGRDKGMAEALKPLTPTQQKIYDGLAKDIFKTQKEVLAKKMGGLPAEPEGKRLKA